jgi:hypothetical protein
MQSRDATTADQDLRESLLPARAEGMPVGALLFTCNGRGTRMVDAPDHDATLISDLVGDIPLAGFFAAGELGGSAVRISCMASPRPRRCLTTTCAEPDAVIGGRQRVHPGSAPSTQRALLDRLTPASVTSRDS